MTAAELQITLIRAIKAYAISMMSPDRTGNANRDILDWSSRKSNNLYEYKENITSAEQVKVLIRGAVPPEFIAAMVYVWSILSLWLALQFSFRPRWADDLDGYGMYRFGTDFAGIAANVPLDGYESVWSYCKFWVSRG